MHSIDNVGPEARSPAPPVTSAVHLPGLNGIRAIAAVAVIVAHTTLLLGTFGLDPFLFGATPEGTPRGTDLAGFGVSMFFALSGFLITYLLLLEKEKQPIDVKSFYIRRVLRIHPLYYTYLAISLVVIFIYGLAFYPVSLFFYIFLAANVPFILNAELPLVGHYWSLGVEEQYYLLYPWLVKKVRNLPVILISLIIGLITIKLVARYFHTSYGLTPYYFLHVTRFQCMLIGAVGAWYFHAGNALFIKLTTNIFTQIVSWIAIGFVALNRFHIASVLDQEIICVVTVFIILGQITKRNRLINLDFGVFDFLGKISYGMYVIHPMVIFFLAKIFVVEMPATLKYVLVYSLSLATTILIAYLSYEYFEKYFLKMKSRFSAVLSSPSRTA
jgi:peptidoglycan/LPS O-acetylase OafA/YrhL